MGAEKIIVVFPAQEELFFQRLERSLALPKYAQIKRSEGGRDSVRAVTWTLDVRY